MLLVILFFRQAYFLEKSSIVLPSKFAEGEIMKTLTYILQSVCLLIFLVLVFGCAGTPEIVPSDIAVAPEKPAPIETSIDRTYTYEGRLDPTDFNNWTSEPYQKGPDGIVYILQNPRKYAAIKFAFVYVLTNKDILSFAYIEDNKLRYFWIIEGNHYKEIDISERVREGLKQSLLIIEEVFDRRGFK